MKNIFILAMLLCIFTTSISFGVSTNDSNIKHIGGIVRQYTNGTWFVQNDVDHKPFGISSSEIVNGKLRVNYDFTATKVITLMMTPDESLLKRGYVVAGGAVGLNATDFSVGRILNAYGGCAYSPSLNKFLVSYNNTVYKISFEDRGNGTIRIYHGDDFDLIPTQLTAREGGYIPKLGIFDKDYFEVSFYKENGDKVTTFDSKCNFLYLRSGYKEVDLTTEQFLESENFWVYGLMDISQ